MAVGNKVGEQLDDTWCRKILKRKIVRSNKCA